MTLTNSLAGFLKFLRTSYLKEHLKHASTLNIVCGNQSSDMDSVMSCLTYAYYSYIKHPDSPIIPVINIPKEDLKLRKDIVFVLNKYANITEDDNLLFFISEIQEYKTSYDCKIHSVLVDHNEKQGLATTVIDEVVGIIDHHEDTGISRDSIKKYNGPDIVRVTGSCSSLVTNYWFDKLGQSATEMKSVLPLGLAAALIDTSNFQSKVEGPDVEALKIYKENMPETFALGEYFKTIKSEKNNLEGLTMYDLLRKDYKMFEFSGFKIGMASLGKSVSWLHQQYGDEEIVESCGKCNQDTDALMLLTSFSENKVHKRELVIVTDNVDLEKKIISGSKGALDLELSSNIKFCYTVYNQKNAQASRKQIAPAVQNSLVKK